MSDHDNEREALEIYKADCGEFFPVMSQSSVFGAGYQAGRAAVKLVQDDSCPQSQWSDAKKARIAAEQVTSTGNTEERPLAESNATNYGEKRFKEEVAAILAWWEENKRLRDIKDKHAYNWHSGPRELQQDFYRVDKAWDAHYHGNRVEMLERCIALLQSGLVVPNTTASPSSPLSEAEWCHIIGEAIRLAEGKADYGLYYEKYMAPKVYAAIKPHLSDTSAEKARVEGLVMALRMVSGRCTPEAQLVVGRALAAFDKEQ